MYAGVNTVFQSLIVCVCASVARSGTMPLLQRWQELKDRELRSQQYNKQLLQQFEEAQDALREMLTLTADMKTIRVHRHKEKNTHTEMDEEFRKYLRKKSLAIMLAVIEALLFLNMYCTPGSVVVNLFLDFFQTEYERYLKESSTRRQQQLKNSQKKVQAPHSLH